MNVQYTALKEENNALRTDLHSANSTIGTLEQNVTDLNQSLQTLIEQNGKLKNTVQAANNAIEKLKKHMDSSQTQIQKRIDSQFETLKAEDKKLMENNKSLRTELNASKVIIERLEQSHAESIRNYDAQFTELRVENEAIKTEMVQKYENSEQSIQRLSGEVQQYKQTNDELLETELNEIKSNLSDLVEKEKKSGERIKEIGDSMQSSGDRISKLRSGLNNMDKSLKDVKGNLNSTKSTVDSVNARTRVQTKVLAMNNGWETYGGSHQATAQKIGNVVYLRGRVRGDPSKNTYMLKLPGGWRPPTHQYFACSYHNTDKRCNIAVCRDGDLLFYGSANQWFQLDGITFVVN